MKLSDFVALFLKQAGIRYVFAIQGGASAHLIDSIAKCDGIDYVCNQHEQASAMAADGYARVSNGLGCAIATSGPGATNLLTGCCGAYYDSIPVLYITGQVASFRLKGNRRIRQLGFQETDTVAIFSPVTKYAALLQRPEDIKFELQKAVSIALEGRKGPVLIDIPDDFQRAMIDVDMLEEYLLPCKREEQKKYDVSTILQLLRDSKRPLLIAGWGIHSAQAENEFAQVMDALHIPVVTTWGANDLLDSGSIYRAGTIGINGSRYGNFAVQTADLIFVLGSRLDTHVAGTPLSKFAPLARKIIVDIDGAELEKYKTLDFTTDILVKSDLKSFIKKLLHEIKKTEDYFPKNISIWKKTVARWKEKYPIYRAQPNCDSALDPYFFIGQLSKSVSTDITMFCDTGCSLVWMCQAFAFKNGQRLFSDFNNTSMGYALPAAIGAAFASSHRIVCITGDGGLQMNIQELATVIRHHLNITLVLFDNAGYGMIQRTQDMWFQSRYEGSDVEHGLAFPDFSIIVKDYGFSVVVVASNDEIEEKLSDVFSKTGPVCCVVKVPLTAVITPQLKFGHGLEDMEPLLPEGEVKKELQLAIDSVGRGPLQNGLGE